MKAVPPLTVAALQDVVEVQAVILHSGVTSRRILSRTYQWSDFSVPTWTFIRSSRLLPGSRATSSRAVGAPPLSQPTEECIARLFVPADQKWSESVLPSLR